MRSPIRIALLAALVAAPLAPRAAEPPPQAKDAELGKKRTFALDRSLAGSIEAKGTPAEAVGPRLDFQSFRYGVEVQVSGKRREEMNDLDQLIRLGGSQTEMPAWMFRLAELHWEEAQYLFFEANRKDDAIAAAKAKSDSPAVDRLRAEKAALDDRSKAEGAAAIGRYREIAKRFPNYPRLDEVVFFLGENLWKGNHRKEALDAYKVLITRFPKSKYVPDAWMAFGEHYFDTADKGNRQLTLRKALETYKRAAAYTESSVYGYALYKQAWVYYNLNAWNEALDLFKAVIYFGDLPTSTIAPDKKLALAREARKDYVRTYSHVGSARAAADDFARVGGKDARDMLRGLAALYFDEGKDRDAIIVYHGLIVADPTAVDAPLFQSRIVTLAGRMGRKELAVQQAARFVDMLRDVEKRASDDKARAALAEARKDAENTLRTLAVQYHSEFRKTREDAVAVLAAELYRMHLAVFPDAPKAYELRFFHAELLYALEKFSEAGEEYQRVAQGDIDRMSRRGPDGAPGKPGKYLVDALETAVQSFDVVAKRAEANEKRPTGDPKTELAIPKEKAQLLAACEAYMKWAPQGEQSVQIAYKAANVYYRYNHFKDAVRLYTYVAEKHPRHELARFSANLALDAYNIQGDWKSVHATAKRFWDDGELMRAHPQLREDLSRVIEGSAFKLVEEAEKKGRHGEAAEAYLAFARDWPGSKLAPTALFNASVDLVRAGRLERAMGVREQLLARYPSDPLVPKIVYTNAQDREAVADFERAASDYERYFEGWRKAARPAATPAARRRGAARKPAGSGPQPSGDAAGFQEARARDALYDAGVLREGLGQYARAESDRLTFVEVWPKAPEAAKVFLSVADLYRRQNAHGKEQRQLAEYQERFARDPDDWLAAQGRIAAAHARSNDGAGERRAYEAALAYYGAHRSAVGERGMPVVAQAQYLALEPSFQGYDKIDFAVPGRLSPQRQVKWLKGQLEVKTRRLLELQKAYTAVVNTKQAEPAVCALYKIGLSYKRFAQALREAPVPSEIRRDKALADEYRSQLAQLADPPEKKSVEALEYAMTKSRELGVSNGCSRAATEILVRYKPDLYGPPPERIPEIAPSAAAVAVAKPVGHALLTALYVPPPAESVQRDEGALAPLSQPSEPREAARGGPVRPAAELPLDEGDEPRARSRPAPLPAPISDEDLLP